MGIEVYHGKVFTQADVRRIRRIDERLLQARPDRTMGHIQPLCSIGDDGKWSQKASCRSDTEGGRSGPFPDLLGATGTDPPQ